MFIQPRPDAGAVFSMVTAPRIIALVLIACLVLPGATPLPGTASTASTNTAGADSAAVIDAGMALLSPANATVAHEALGGVGADFEMNTGQQPDEVKFFARGPGYTLFITQTEFVTVLAAPRAATESKNLHFDPSDPMSRERPTPEPGEPGEVIRMSLAGVNPAPTVRGEGLLEHKSNYFIGNDPTKWHTDVPHYTRVVIDQIYPGIDLVWYGADGGALEYDFIVAPGADPALVQMVFAGAQASLAPDGGLVLSTPEGNELRHEAPKLFQGETRVGGAYVLAGRTVGFSVPDYDGTASLRIDPILAYSTYLGGTSDDYGRSVAVDSTGAAYLTGYTSSSDFPLANAYQTTYAGGYPDAFVTKLTPAGNMLAYSTYLGGDRTDIGWGVAVDSSGAAYVTGQTCSWDFPVVNAYQDSQRFCDVFVAKVMPAGNDLVYSTYLGGAWEDYGQSIAVDPSGAAYVTGYTGSGDFPVANSVQATPAGDYDAFVTKLTPAGNDLAYSTYLGGASTDIGMGVAVDTSGAAYVTGYTNSSNFPVINAAQATHAGGWADVYVTKLTPAGDSLAYSTYLGGSDDDYGWGVAVGSGGAAYVTGFTGSGNFRVVNPYQPTPAGDLDAFVVKLTVTGNALAYATYLGGAGSDYGLGVAVDTSGAAYVAGATCSSNFPLVDPYPDANHSSCNAFVAKLTSAGNNLAYSTYLGGSNDDNGWGVAVDARGAAYVTGETCSADFPAVNPYPGANHGCVDAFVTKLVTAVASLVATSDPTGGLVVPGTSASDTASVSGTGATPTGTVAFFLCHPSQVTAGGCEGMAGAQIGGAIDLIGGTATSAATTDTNVVGKYCWRAEYSGDALYPAIAYTDSAASCFTVQTPPTAPRNLVAARSSSLGVVDLEWEVPASDGAAAITNYRLYRGTQAGGPYPTLIEAGNQLTYSDSVSRSGTYYYVAMALNEVGEGPGSNEAYATAAATPASPPSIPIPGPLTLPCGASGSRTEMAANTRYSVEPPNPRGSSCYFVMTLTIEQAESNMLHIQAIHPRAGQFIGLSVDGPRGTGCNWFHDAFGGNLADTNRQQGQCHLSASPGEYRVDARYPPNTDMFTIEANVW